MMTERDAPLLVGPDDCGLLRALLDATVADPAQAGVADDALRLRLLARVAHSVRAAGALHTRRGQLDWQTGAAHRSVLLYQCRAGLPLRAGEPLRVRQLELGANARAVQVIATPGARCEWLVMAGDVRIDGMPLAERDYHVAFAGESPFELSSKRGSRLYLREAADPLPMAQPHTMRDVDAPWLAHGSGIERRVLWRRGAEAALLYRVQPGAAVPCHVHGHDEECLMLDGEVFVDDLLLRAGEYQLAPAGTQHEGVSSDVGGVLFAHGDIDLALEPQ